jgi:hypothetical protein
LSCSGLSTSGGFAALYFYLLIFPEIQGGDGGDKLKTGEDKSKGMDRMQRNNINMLNPVGRVWR